MFGVVARLVEAVVVGVIVILSINWLSSHVGGNQDPLQDPVIRRHNAAQREWLKEDRDEQRRPRAASTDLESRRRRLDNLLRKIAKDGIESLTREERVFLDTASLEFTYKKEFKS